MLRLSAGGALLLWGGLALAASPPDLAQDHGCMSCHGLERKQVGPGFAQIAMRYRDDAGAPQRLAAKIRNGGVGTWGRISMPRQPKLSDAEALFLARWVLSQPIPR